MILYTPIVESDIFPAQDQKSSNRSVIIHRNKTIFVENNGDGNYKVVQLLSTDPKDFMDPQYQPGSILSSH